MPDKTPENELREIWRSQSTEQMEMKLEVLVSDKGLGTCGPRAAASC